MKILIVLMVVFTFDNALAQNNETASLDSIYEQFVELNKNVREANYASFYILIGTITIAAIAVGFTIYQARFLRKQNQILVNKDRPWVAVEDDKKGIRLIKDKKNYIEFDLFNFGLSPALWVYGIIKAEIAEDIDKIDIEYENKTKWNFEELQPISELTIMPKEKKTTRVEIDEKLGKQIQKYGAYLEAKFEYTSDTGINGSYEIEGLLKIDRFYSDVISADAPMKK